MKDPLPFEDYQALAFDEGIEYAAKAIYNRLKVDKTITLEQFLEFAEAVLKVDISKITRK